MAAHQAPPSLGFSGKNTGVGCHFLLQCKKVKSESEVAQWCPTLSDPMDCSLPGSSIHGIFQARVLEWVATAFSVRIIRKIINTKFICLETQVLWPPHTKSWLIGKDSDAGRGWGQEEKGMTEDEMAGWHHRLHEREFEWTPGDGDGQGGLACCDSWGRKESDTTEWLNWTELKLFLVLWCSTCFIIYNTLFTFYY